MLDLFLNPWSMIAGAALISLPIIIHLINRMRFKRVRWAAMEFLLKAQKRMKRKLIFQQLLLLLLRILMVLLIGMIVGRFLGFNPFDGTESRKTTHIVILDDSPSMGDRLQTEDGQTTDAFNTAKKVLLEQICPAASQATTPQMISVLKLSQPEEAKDYGRINATTMSEIGRRLKDERPAAVRGDLAASIRKAKALFPGSETTDQAQVLHILSDFRTIDWLSDGPAIKSAIEELTSAKTKIHLVDVAHPYRKDEKRPPLFHDNLSLVELRPAKLVVARYESLEFSLRVRNSGVSEVKDLRITILVNGDEAKGQSVSIANVPSQDERTARFSIAFDRIGTPEAPHDRFSMVTARLETVEPGGLIVDNVRHAVVEVRDKLPMLIVDGRPTLKDKKEGDSFYLRTIFTSVIGGFNWVAGTPRDLEGDLKPFSTVWLLNVPTVSELAAKNLTTYAKDGGGVAFFLGPDVKPGDYNKSLYADGTRLFPVPLPDRPSEPLADEKRLERLFSFTKKVLLRDKIVKTHPSVSAIYTDDRGQLQKDDELEKFFNFVLVSQYWPIARFGKWRDDPSTTEIYCMPNEQSMGEFDKLTTDLLNKLPIEEPKYQKYRELLSKEKTAIRQTALSTEPLYKLASQLDQFMADQRSDGDASSVLLREFWSLAELADLRQQFQRLRDAVKYGDPLYLAKQYGRGRVTLLTTTAGETWNDWPSGPGRPAYVPIISEMERYLSGGGVDDEFSVGSSVKMMFEADQYKPVVFRTRYDFDPFAGGMLRMIPVKRTDLKEQGMVTIGTTHEFDFKDGTVPGVYLFEFTSLKNESLSGGESREVADYRAIAMNIDAKREGDLRRIGRDDLLQDAPTALLHSAGESGWVDALKNKQTDLTEGGWIFLVLLMLLIAEQTLASRLSYNTAGADAPSLRSPLRAS